MKSPRSELESISPSVLLSSLCKTRSRVWLCILYPDSSTHKPIDEIVQSLTVLNAHFAYCLHFGEVNTLGEVLKDHIHLYLEFPSSRFGNAVSGITGSILLQVPRDPVASFRYLTHMDELDKKHYPIEDLHHNYSPEELDQHLTFTSKKVDKKQEDFDSLLRDIEDLSFCLISYRSFLRKHPAFLYRYKSLEDLVALVKSDLWDFEPPSF